MNLVPGALVTQIESTPVWLLPDKAVFLPQQKTLMMADVHIGKAATFRSLGVPVPGGTTQENLQRLAGLVEQTQASRLVILGDLFHGPQAKQVSIMQAFGLWRQSLKAVDVVLITGNHDAKARLSLAAFGVREVANHCLATVPGFALNHEPTQPTAGEPFAFCGHWHPVFRITGKAKSDSLRLPCFWRQAHQLVLPAFGEFTGGHPVDFQTGDAVYVTDGEKVHAVSPIKQALIAKKHVKRTVSL
jgi:uncharacterized protein